MQIRHFLYIWQVNKQTEYLQFFSVMFISICTTDLSTELTLLKKNSTISKRETTAFIAHIFLGPL